MASSQAPRKHFSQVTQLLAEKLVASSQAPRPSLFRKYLLAEKLECALLRLVSRLAQTRKRLLTRRMLLAAYNAPLLRLHEVLLLESAARVLGRSMVHHRLRTHRLHRTATHVVLACRVILHVHVLRVHVVLASRVVARVHLYL